MATAALPDWPPMVTTKSEACTFWPACGNVSTRITMSCTAPPAHRIVGRLLKAHSVFHPGAHDVIGDCDAGRAGETLRVLAHQHRGDLVPAEPARVFELVLVDHNLVGQRLRVRAHHQRGRKRPR